MTAHRYRGQLVCSPPKLSDAGGSTPADRLAARLGSIRESRTIHIETPIPRSPSLRAAIRIADALFRLLRYTITGRFVHHPSATPDRYSANRVIGNFKYFLARFRRSWSGPPVETKMRSDYGRLRHVQSFWCRDGFQDAAGRYWLRQGNGFLQRSDQDPSTCHDIDRPVPGGTLSNGP